LGSSWANPRWIPGGSKVAIKGCLTAETSIPEFPASFAFEVKIIRLTDILTPDYLCIYAIGVNYEC